MKFSLQNLISSLKLQAYMGLKTHTFVTNVNDPLITRICKYWDVIKMQNGPEKCTHRLIQV